MADLNAGQYQPLIDASAAKYGIDPTWLTKLLWQENKFKPTGTSPAGAQGMAQFMPGTAARYGVNVNNPASSIEGAAHYLSDNLKMFGGNQGLATAAYNWGEGNVQNWLNKGGSVPKETQQYVSNITGTPITTWAGAGGASSRLAVTPPTASGPIDPSIIARGGVSPPIPATTSPAATPTTGALASGGGAVLPSFADAKTSNQFLQNLDQFDKSLGGRGLGLQGQGQGEGQGQPDMPRAPVIPPPDLRNASSAQSIGRAASQMLPSLTHYQPQAYGQTLNSDPLAIGAGTPQQPDWLKNAGLQQAAQPSPYGTSIGSMQMAYGLSPQQLQMLMNPMMLAQSGGGYG